MRAKLSPWERSASTASSMVCACSGSSQVPNASARRGVVLAANTPMSPKRSGSSAAGAQAISSCGSQSSSACARSSCSRSTVISCRAALAVWAARTRVRTNRMAVTTANEITPRSSATTATSWRSSGAKSPGARAIDAGGPRSRASTPSAPVAMPRRAARAADRPRQLAARRLNVPARIMSGILTAPGSVRRPPADQAAMLSADTGRVRHAAPESLQCTSKRWRT